MHNGKNITFLRFLSRVLDLILFNSFDIYFSIIKDYKTPIGSILIDREQKCQWNELIG